MLSLALLLAAPAAWHLTPGGYGPARIGMTRAQVSAALSAPLEGEAIEDANACIEMTAAQGHPDLVFMFTDGRLSRITAVRESRVTTPRGIGVGATEGAVRRAYRAGLVSEPHHYDGLPARYLTYWTRPRSRGVRFVTGTDRRVGAIHAGDATIRQIEGCA